MTHAIVTTVGGGYTRYLDDWADSIAAQTIRPDQIVIVDNGADRPGHVRQVASRLDADLIRLDRPVNWGRARNIAVAATSTVWVQHFDCDDIMRPWALEETARVIADRPEADVVQWGWESGPVERIYLPYDGREVFEVGPKAAGVSPFRRTLWERAPYDDLLDGAWDTGLWIGFGHLDAKFRPTSRPCFTYRRHRNSILNLRLRDRPLRTHVAGQLGASYTAKPPAVVVMPWRDTGDTDRARSMAWCKARWESYGLPVILADSDPDLPFNLAEARNAGAAAAHARVLVVADADVMVDRNTIADAVRLAHTAPWIVPHSYVHRLDGDATRQLLDHPADVPLPTPGQTIRQPYLGFAGGGLIVITPGQYRRAGGYDEQFVGWGCEDEAFGCAAATLIGPPERLETPLWHLYHDPGLRSRDPAYRPNRARLGVYRAAAGDPTLMAALRGQEGNIMAGIYYRDERRGKTVGPLDPELNAKSIARFERLVAFGRYSRIGDAPTADADVTEDAGDEDDGDEADLEVPPRAGRGSSRDAWTTYAATVAPELDVDELTRDEIIDRLESEGVITPETVPAG